MDKVREALRKLVGLLDIHKEIYGYEKQHYLLDSELWDEARAALSQSEGWIPIETAPKGTRVLLFGYASTWSGGDDLTQPIIRCGILEEFESSRMEPVEGTEMFRQVAVTYSNWRDDESYPTDSKLRPPTHWMPLPPLPNKEMK